MRQPGMPQAYPDIRKVLPPLRAPDAQLMRWNGKSTTSAVIATRWILARRFALIAERPFFGAWLLQNV